MIRLIYLSFGFAISFLYMQTTAAQDIANLQTEVSRLTELTRMCFCP